MASRHIPRIADWRIADGVRVEELDGTWLALDAAGGVVYRLEALAAEAVRHVAHRMPLPARLVPAARELAGHGVLEHPLVDRRTALVGAGVVTLTGLAATLLPAASAAASTNWGTPNTVDWPVSSVNASFSTATDGGTTYYFHEFRFAYDPAHPAGFPSGTLTVRNTRAISDVSLLIIGGGGGGGGGGGTGAGAGGGGGAGQLLRMTGGALPEPGGRTSYDMRIQVGAGGFGAGQDQGNATPNGAGESGADTSVEIRDGGSTLLSFTAKGGGGGGAAAGLAATLGGLAGGSSGGSGAGTAENATANGTPAGTGGSSESDLLASFPDPAVRQRLAFAGGAGLSSNTNGEDVRAGGGGGAGGAGVDGGVGVVGSGGSALQVIEFSSFGAEEQPGYFAGGGGGALGNVVRGVSSLGGGGGAGRGGNTTNDGGSAGGFDGSGNTGSGGGGGTGPIGFGGYGAVGVVLVRYRLN